MALAVVSAVASEEDSTVAVAVVVSAVGSAAVVEDSEEVMALAEKETASVHQAEPHPAQEEATGGTVIAGLEVVGMNPEADDPLKTDQAVASVMAAAALAVTWSPLAAGTVGFAIEKEIVTVTVIGTETGKETEETEVAETTIGHATMTAANEALKEAATMIRGSCDDTKLCFFLMVGIVPSFRHAPCLHQRRL